MTTQNSLVNNAYEKYVTFLTFSQKDSAIDKCVKPYTHECNVYVSKRNTEQKF